MGRTLEDNIAEMVPEGKEDDAILEVKQALVQQILHHSKDEIHEVISWVDANTSDSDIRSFLLNHNISIRDVIFVLANLA